MYREADKTINEGLSLPARILLGCFAGIFGLVMVIVAPPTDRAIGFYAFGGFCLAIAIACVVTGRLRQFVGSFIGLAIFLLAGWYAFDQLVSGSDLIGPRSEPNVVNSLLFMLFFGVPGISYVYRARFGFRKREPDA